MTEEGGVPKENFLLLFSAPLAFIFLHEERALPGVYLQWDARSKEKEKAPSYVSHILHIQSSSKDPALLHGVL